VMVLERGRASLTLIESDSNDTGCYELVLTNEFGCSRLASSVTVEGRFLMKCMCLYIYCL